MICLLVMLTNDKDHYIMVNPSSLEIIKEYNVYGVKCYEIKYKKDTLIAVTKN